jgi:hypothetical protein
MRSRSHTALNGITVPGDLTEPSRFPNRRRHDSRRRGSPVCPASESCCAGATVVSNCSGARRGLAGRGGEDWRHGSSDAAGLGDPVQRAGSGRSHQYSFSGMPPKLNAIHRAFLARIVEEGPIAAIHGVVRWRACDLIMRLHEEFGLSVFGRYDLSRPQGLGLLACERPAQGLQAEC